MITKGGIDAISRSLAMEYARDGIRVNTVAPGVVDTPLHKHNAKEFLKTLSPMASISKVEEIVDAVVFLDRGPAHNRGGAARRWRRTFGQMVNRDRARPAGAEQRLKELGLVLPSPPTPLGAYVEAVRSGNWSF